MQVSEVRRRFHPSSSSTTAHSLLFAVTFFVMPAVFNSLVSLHSISIRIAWRVSFLVPCILLLAVGLAVLLLTDDTPLGPWSERAKNQPRRESTQPVLNSTANSSMTVFDRPECPSKAVVKDLKKNEDVAGAVERRESESSELPPPPPKQSFGSQLKDLACLPTLMLCASYFATFGASLAVNTSLLSWYMAKFDWSQTYAANWAAL
jgi:NNP family nitrate/nitrite transporter-like MFS transporter